MESTSALTTENHQSQAQKPQDPTCKAEVFPACQDDRSTELCKLLASQPCCVICLEEWKTQQNSMSHTVDLINRLVPCGHLQCNACFVKYHQNKACCPVCQQAITHTSLINSMTLTESSVLSPFLQDEIASLQQMNGGQDADIFQSFDHQYFQVEIKNMIRLRDTIEHERFFTRRLN